MRFAAFVPSGYHNDFKGYLYNQNLFLSLREGECLSCYALSDERRAVLAHIHFSICQCHASDDVQAISLPHSPFGSLEFGKALNQYTLMGFVRYFISILKEKKVHRIKVRHFTSAYDPENTAMLSEILPKAGFNVIESILNHHIEVNEIPLECKMHQWEVRKLNKCRKAGFLFREEPLDKLAFIYRFICDCRESQQRKLSMDYPQLEQHVKAIPGAYQLFALYDQSKLIAAAITVKVHEQILYTFYYAATAHYKRFSPTVMLLEGIYHFCQKSEITTMDLGTSPTDSVRQFKIQMGGIVSPKQSFGLVIR